MSLKKESLKTNMILNAIKGIASVLFPLITFPYVSKVLGVSNIGKYSFSSSVISYFLLLAELGISTYAIREGAKIRENRYAIENFSSEMFSINCYSSMASFFLFLAFLYIVPSFGEYSALLIILSLQILFKPIGVEWLYSIYEDYLYITLRTVGVYLISIIFLLLCVRNRNDVNTYALIMALSFAGSNLVNYLHGRKYCRLRLVKSVNCLKHIKPILILFAMTATVVVYVSSDTTILGLLCDDYTVGIYSVSTKVYSIVKTILSAIIIVSIPRLATSLGNNEREAFINTLEDVYKTLVTALLPAVTGIIILKTEIVCLISDTVFLEATSSLSLLSIALFFCMGAWLWGQCVLVIYGKEKTVFKVTLVSALLNIILNFIMIPLWKENAAAFTTILAEALAFTCCRIAGGKLVHIRGIWKHYIKVILGCLIIVLVGVIVHRLNRSNLFNVCMISFSSLMFYIVVEVLVKNDSIIDIINGIKNKHRIE